ncbi:MAG: hypothetical protein M3P10_00625 [Actinomycetota bacterium]|nr:hypothetical protein [Actinomycetota bacterium]
MERRAFLLKASIVGAGALATPMLSRLPEAWGAGACHFGSTAQQRSGQTQQEALHQLERLVGRRFSTVHNRMAWDVPLVNSYSTWAVKGGRTPILSWFARRPTGSLIGFRSIANGDHDRWITHQARSLRRSGWSGYLCWHKEPEDETNPAEWKAAYARVRRIFKNVGVTRFRWVVCLIASTYAKGEARRWLPRADWDLLGVDTNNRYTCRGFPWKPFPTLFGPAHDFARARGKKLFVVEFASVEGEAGRKAQWFDNARATIKSWPEVVGVSHINENSDCTYWVNTSQSALGAFRRMAFDPYFK